MKGVIAAIDQGTTSTRCILFDHSGSIISHAQIEHRQIFPQPGWVEHNPLEIWQNTQQVIRTALQNSPLPRLEIAAVGITNQRETTLVWDRETGNPYYNAIVWQDTRTAEICSRLALDGGQDRFRTQTGLPISTYFSGPKLHWFIKKGPSSIGQAIREKRILFGTIDSWLIWWLTGGPNGGRHVIDVTNASRTMLMNLTSLDWDETILADLEIPREILPSIVPSSDPSPWGYTLPDGPFSSSIPVCGDLGDQQAALFGQACLKPGEAKNTYGTGCFLLLNTGDRPVQSKYGLLTTLAYKIGNQPAVYALEGSIAIAGALVQWLKDNLGLIQSYAEIESVASSVTDNGGVYIVPAFSGLFAPYWRSEARGIIAGLSRFTNRGHIARAALEASAYQTREVLGSMEKDTSQAVLSLKVDGGMVHNELLMQFQADILNIPVVRPRIAETTALGAAYAAGLAIGFWDDLQQIRTNWQEDKRWQPKMDPTKRDAYFRHWLKAVDRSLNWLE